MVLEFVPIKKDMQKTEILGALLCKLPQNYIILV